MLESTYKIHKEKKMLVEIEDTTVITTMFNDELLTLSDSAAWSIWLKDTRDLSDNTVKVFMKAMERFWIWSLYNPVKIDERFPSFQARYRKALREGFKILIKSDEHDTEIEICSCVPLTKSTINKELAGINSYFYFTEESELIEDHRFINHLYERQRSAKSFLSGVKVKTSSTVLEAHGKKLSYMPPYKISRNRKHIKYFPLELFDELLKMAKPRERLIYLLCGACSARIGQALNLTLYDLDFERQAVWLLDPKSDYPDIYKNKRKVWLKEEYAIDMNNDNEHNTPDLQFKYPIPLYHEELYWLHDKYKDMFFDTLAKYMRSENYISENARYPTHPFLFVTKNGRRVHSRDTLSRFKATLRKLSEAQEGMNHINDLGLHSLRHFFGHSMAELYAATGDETLFLITMEAMGHASEESTNIYFRMSSKTKKEILKKHAKNIYAIKEKNQKKRNDSVHLSC